VYKRQVQKRGNSLVVSGELTIKGVTKPVSIPFQISGWLPATQRAGMKMGITGETTINRRDFNVNYGNNLPSGIPAIGNDVKVALAIEAMKARETPPAQ
jgi:polyisoprenoid-binding protein YceI